MKSDDGREDCKIGHRDLLQMTGVTKDGDYTYVRHRANHEGETGVLRIPKEGKPLQNPIALKSVNDQGLFEVEVLAGVSEPVSKGPAKVSTDEYRDGWDRIFGGKKTVGQA